MSSVLQINNLTKFYGDIVAVNDVSFEVESESIFGILGPNGSGKTTTLGIILDVIRANSGEYSWFGEAKHNRSTKKRIGAILETPNFYPYLTGRQNLKIVADIKGVPYLEIDKTLDKVGLLGRRSSKFKEYSLGMKQRLAIGSALLSNPDVLILDEPTNGLDPEGIIQIRELIKNIATEGKTIILASHLLDEVEKVCTHVGILKTGKLLQYGNVNEILSEDAMYELNAENFNGLKQFLLEIRSVRILEEKKEGILIQVSDEQLTASLLNKKLHDKGIILTHLVAKKKSLEEQFLEIVK